MRFVAGWGAVAKLHQEDAGRGAVTEMLLAGGAVAERHREDANQHRDATASGSASGEAPSGRRCPQGDALRIRIGKMLMTGSCPQGAALGSSIGKPHRSERPLAREKQRVLIPEISFLIFAYFDKLLTMRFVKFISVLATVAMAGCLTAFATSPSSTAFHPEDETFSESCTTISVG